MQAVFDLPFSRHLLVFYTYLIAALSTPLSFTSHYIMAQTLQTGKEWFLHTHLSSSLPVGEVERDDNWQIFLIF